MGTTNMNLFEYATRNKLRFAYKGVISVEDLWDLDLESLDYIYKGLKKQTKVDEEEGLLTKKVENEKLNVAIKIVEHIFNVKKEEIEKAKNQALKKAEKQKLLAILANKKEAELENKSVEELEKMIEELE